MRRYRLTTRVRGKVEHERFNNVEAALVALERSGHRLQGQADAESVGGSLMRRYEPEQLVSARLEIRGRGVHGGVDIRGDGSAVPFSGRFLRKEIVRADGENAYDALRRTLSE